MIQTQIVTINMVSLSNGRFDHVYVLNGIAVVIPVVVVAVAAKLKNGMGPEGLAGAVHSRRLFPTINFSTVKVASGLHSHRLSFNLK